MIALTPSHIIEYLYCPRFTYFEYVLGISQNEEKYYKVMRGREIHDEKLERNKDYLRKKIGAIKKLQDQYLANQWLRGRVDEVLELEDGSMAPLDYKFAEYKGRIFETYRYQQYCYAWLIEENFGKSVNKGFLVYTRSKHHLEEVAIDERDKKLVREAAMAIQEIIDNNFFPKATRFKRRCLDCTYRNICIK
ncbi:MAG: CRISPR-associated protein Cas4 [Cyclobacteriaceae bacterium]